LAMTDEDILLEYEAVLAYSGEELKECPKCGLKTHRKHCTGCKVNDEPLQLTGDALGDELAACMEAGENLDIEAFIRSGGKERTPLDFNKASSESVELASLFDKVNFVPVERSTALKNTDG